MLMSNASFNDIITDSKLALMAGKYEVCITTFVKTTQEWHTETPKLSLLCGVYSLSKHHNHQWCVVYTAFVNTIVISGI